MAKTLFGKTAKLEAPYAIYRGYGPLGDTEVRVLKTYQSVDKERSNPYARWMVAVKCDTTYGRYDMGDSYIKEAILGLTLVEATDEWKAVYNV